MSAPVSSQQIQPPNQPPPIPPAKPILSSPGAYMANFTSSQTTATAGIHSVNKSHEKPAIAARPIPPPTLPKYSSSFNKVDRDRNDFAKIDRAEREKVLIIFIQNNCLILFLRFITYKVFCCCDIYVFGEYFFFVTYIIQEKLEHCNFCE